MSDTVQGESPSIPKRRGLRRIVSCAAIALGIPLLLAVVVAFIFAWNNRPPAISVPTPRMPAQNAYDEFNRLGERVRLMKHKGPLSQPGGNMSTAEVAACAREARPILADLRKALALPYLHPPIRSWYDNYSGAPVRSLARLVTGVAIYDENRGDFGTAAETLLDGLEMAVKIPRGGTFLTDMVEDACISIVGRRLDNVLRKVPDDSMPHVVSRMKSIASQMVPFSEIVREEGNSVVASYAHWLKEPRTFRKYVADMREHYEMVRSGISGFSSPPPPPTWQSELGTAVEVARLVIADKTAMLREMRDYYRGLESEVSGPYRGPSNTPIPKNPFAYACELVGREGWMLHARSESMVKLLLTQAALHCYRSERENYPQTLAELIPKYLDSIPADSFGGSPLKYRRKGAGFLLYSVGPDLKNDDGRSILGNVHSGPGDVVAGNLWPARRSTSKGTRSP